MIVLLLSVALILTGCMAQYYRILSEDAHKWVDEIIEALESSDEESSNESVDSLIDQRK